jgi:hypothetical protein
VNGHPGQFLADGYPTGKPFRNLRIVVSINRSC